MGTVYTLKSGRREVQQVIDGERRKISLGYVSAEDAQDTLRRIESLVANREHGRPHDSGLAAWVESLPNGPFRERLAELELIMSATKKRFELEPVLAEAIKSLDVKASTLVTYRQTVTSLIGFFWYRFRHHEGIETLRRAMETEDESRKAGYGDDQQANQDSPPVLRVGSEVGHT